jgi:hypothetical protein
MTQSHSSTHHTSQLYTLSNINSTKQHELTRKLYNTHTRHTSHSYLTPRTCHPPFPQTPHPWALWTPCWVAAAHTPATTHTTDNTRAPLQTPCNQTNSTGVRTEMCTHAVQVMPPKPCTITQTPKPYTNEPPKPSNSQDSTEHSCCEWAAQTDPGLSGLQKQGSS